MKWTLQRQKESFFRFTILTAFFRCCFLKAFHGNKTRQELARFGCLEFKPYSQLNSHLTMQQYKTLQRRHTLRNSERSLYGRVLKQCFKSALSSPLERSSRLTARYEKQNKDAFVLFRKVNRCYFAQKITDFLLRSGRALLCFILAQELGHRCLFPCTTAGFVLNHYLDLSA